MRIVPQPLTPNEIRQRELPRSLRGYRGRNAAADRGGRRSIRGGARTWSAPAESVSRRERDSEALVKALVTAERAADEMVVEAKEETAAILAEARATARR